MQIKLKKKIIIFFFLLISTFKVASASQYNEDLKKVSKENGFVDNKSQIYKINPSINKESTIIIIYTHGVTKIDWELDPCFGPPNLILSLHDTEIKGKKIKIYKLCSGVRGWTNSEQEKMYQGYKKNNKLDLTLKDEKGVLLAKKFKQIQKLKVMYDTAKKFHKEGYRNIILAGHSVGGWNSLRITSYNQKIIRGAIALSPAAGGKLDNKKKFPWWIDIMHYGFSKPNYSNSIVFYHPQDEFMESKHYGNLKKAKKIEWINIKNNGCKDKDIEFHSMILWNCFDDGNYRTKTINYLNRVF